MSGIIWANLSKKILGKNQYEWYYYEQKKFNW